MIESNDGRFQVTISGKTYFCDKVILALGNRGVPRKLGIPGEDGANVFYNLLEADEFSGSTVTVIGAGDSAIEAALALQKNGCRVTMLVRGDGFPKAKARNVRSASGRPSVAGKIRVHFNSQPLEIGAISSRFSAEGTRRARKRTTRSSSWSAANCLLSCWKASASRSSKKKSDRRAGRSRARQRRRAQCRRRRARPLGWQA